MNLTDNFTLEEMTRTNHPEFAVQNSQVDPTQIGKLTQVCKVLLEPIRLEIGVPLLIHSGYRCKPLNDAVGSTDRSQHLLCEASDFSPIGMDLTQAFKQIWNMVKIGQLNIGQLIFETQNRQYGTDSWIHISLGIPWRDVSVCNEILRMIDGKYELIDKC